MSRIKVIVEGKMSSTTKKNADTQFFCGRYAALYHRLLEQNKKNKDNLH